MSIFDSQSQRQLISRYIGNSAQAGVSLGEEDVNMDEKNLPNSNSQLSPEDLAVDLELESIEEQFLAYRQSPFNIAELRFNLKEHSDTLVFSEAQSLDLDELLDYLPMVFSSTKKLVYRAEGYRRLINILRGLECSTNGLITRRSDLLTIISTELNRLLTGVTEELKAQATMGTHHEGARRIQFASSSGKRISPIVMASVVLIAIIHCMMGVARDHCNLILKCLRCILQLVANMQNSQAAIFASTHIDPIPITLPTALHYLALQDDLEFYVVCPTCDTLYKLDTEPGPPDQCSHVNIDGKTCNTALFTQYRRGNRTWRKPIRRFSHHLLECWLARFLLRPDVEDWLESARLCSDPLCTDVWGASYLADFPGNGEPVFFDAPAGELRLGFLLYYDHFNPYMLKIAGKKRSSGLVMMVCLNLPPEVRYDLKNIYVTAMLPGPKEPTQDTINNFMRPIVDNLLEHYSPGVYISKTHKYPKGRKVRSAVPISSMDIMASRPWAGIAGPSHTLFCSFCDTPISEIDNFNLASFNERTLDTYLVGLQHWDAARNATDRNMVWADHAVRRSEWSRFPWWNPHTGTLVGPLHWNKNVLEKHIRENMGCSTVLHSDKGVLEAPPLSRAITTVEAQWGYKSLLYLSAGEFEKAGFPEPLLRFMCRDQGIYEAGLPSKQLTKALNAWRLQKSLIRTDGTPVQKDRQTEAAIAKAEYYLSKVEDSLTILESHSTIPALRGLCDQFSLPWTNEDKKQALMQKLVKYYKNVTIVDLPDTEPRAKRTVPLGLEVVEQIKEDMQRTNLPSWIKQPPINFATTDHGKLASEEFKSLALVSLPITLVRLWSAGNDVLRERLDNFLHLSIVIRILAYQSLTANDEAYLDYHYLQYVHKLKELYPYSSITPVQHLGLHLSYFLRTLGPATRYSENTCEMFIGMLEEIGTNFRSGELEQTLHRELIMAANLKSMTERWNFSEILQPYGEIIGDFLRNRYPGSEVPSSMGWYTKHKGAPLNIDQDTYASLCAWADSAGIAPFTRRLHVCTQLRRGNVAYQPFTESRGNSCISFRPRGATAPVPGRVEVILKELEEAVGTGNKPRIVVLARSFPPLTEADAAKDPYRNHPIVGVSRFRIMELFYDTVGPEVHIIEPDDIVSHVAVCRFFDDAGIISAPSSVVVSLDLKHMFCS